MTMTAAQHQHQHHQHHHQHQHHQQKHANTAKERQRRAALVQQFHDYYAKQYGAERWTETLLPALLRPTRYACLINRFANAKEATLRLCENMDPAMVGALQQMPGITAVPCLVLPSTITTTTTTTSTTTTTTDKQSSHSQPDRPFPPPSKDFQTHLSTYYLLDGASVLVTEALDVQPGQRILDLCSAPGGKALCIAQRLFHPPDASQASRLTCNEWDGARRKRLLGVLQDYLPPQLLQESRESFAGEVRVLGRDGTRFTMAASEGGDSWEPPLLYDRVLIDAPCSSERHLLHDVDALVAQWTQTKSKNMAQKQLQLVLEAWKRVRIGGRLVYATCSLSDAENDGVVQAAVEKLGGSSVVQVLSRKWRRKWEQSGVSRWPIGEPTKFGWIVLPDSRPSTWMQQQQQQQQEKEKEKEKGGYDLKLGWGPLYFAVLIKLS